MSLQVEKLDDKMAKLIIEVPVEDVEKALDESYKKQRNRMSIPGFRKGKAPRKMVEKFYGTEIFFEDAGNALISREYEKAYDECELEIVSRPEINVVQMEKGKPFIFTATVALKPKVALGVYKGVRIQKCDADVTEDDINQRLAKEAEKNARTIEVKDRAVMDRDEVILDYEGFVDGVAFEGGKAENYPLVVGSGSFIPGFEEQLIGANSGDDIEVKVTFPEEYHSKDLSGKDAVFKCRIHEIKAKEIPEIDDEFASEVSEHETLESYKEELRNQMREDKEALAKEQRENHAVEKAVSNSAVELPEAMVDTHVEQMAEEFGQRMRMQGLTTEQYFQITGMTAEKMREEMRPEAEKRIKTRLVLEAVVKAEGIVPGEDRINEELKSMAERYKMDEDKLKDYMSKREMNQIRDDIAMQEAITLIADNAIEEQEEQS